MQPVPTFQFPTRANTGSLFVRKLSPILAIVIAMVAAGCADPLLSPDEPRSQFDRYDAVRDQRAATTYTDEFGFKRPNIRGRLLPKE